MTHPNLTIAHTLLLIALDDETGRSIASNKLQLDFSLCGAAIVELQFRQRMIPARANYFGIVDGPALPAPLAYAAEHLGPKPRKLHRAVGKLRNIWWNPSMRNTLIDDLVSLGVVERKKDRFLAVPYRTRYPLAEGSSDEAVLRDALIEYVRNVKTEFPPSPLDGLLSLLRYLSLLEEVLGPELAHAPQVEKRTAVSYTHLTLPTICSV